MTIARKRQALRRGGGIAAVELDEAVHSGSSAHTTIEPEEILALDDALKSLQELSPRQASVVECRVFAGLSVEETARALDISTPTVKRDWQTARAWLALALGHA